MSINLDALKAPFAPNKISWRIGSTNADKSKGMALAYIDARDVQDRLDEVCGLGGWQNRYIPMHDKKTVCEIGILVHREDFAVAGVYAEWVWKADGAGDSDVEAEKGALSDAFKRSAVKWGIGRYLYDIPSPWVAITAAGRSFKIADHEYTRLEALLAKDAPKPAAAKQPGGDVYAPEHVKVPEPPKAPATITPAAWLQLGIDRIPTLDRKGLDEFTEKHHAKMAKVRTLEPDLHAKLIKAIQDRQAELF
jgi:hypothetical protein